MVSSLSKASAEAAVVKEDSILIKYHKELDATIVQVRENLRTASDLTSRQVSFRNLEKYIYTAYDNGGIRLYNVFDEFLRKSAERPLWGQIESRIRAAADQAFSFLQSGRKITLLTGGSSVALINIDQVSRMSTLGGQPAFVPPGISLLHNIAPFAGELEYGIQINGVNQHSLSFVDHQHWSSAVGYAHSSSFIFNRDFELRILLGETGPFGTDNRYVYNFDCLLKIGRIARIKIALIRLLQLGNLTEAEKSAIREKFDKEIKGSYDMPLEANWKRHANLVGLDAPTTVQSTPITETTVLQRGQIVIVIEPRLNGPDRHVFSMICDYRQNIRGYESLFRNGIRGCNPIGSIRLPQAKELDEISSRLPPVSGEALFSIEKRIQGRRNELLEMRQLLDTMPPLLLTADQQKLLSDPFPIMWASTTVTKVIRVHSYFVGEAGVRGKMVIGSDVQLAFTNPANVKRLQEIVSPLGVQVMTFDAAAYILGRRSEERPDLEFVD